MPIPMDPFVLLAAVFGVSGACSLAALVLIAVVQGRAETARLNAGVPTRDGEPRLVHEGRVYVMRDVTPDVPWRPRYALGAARYDSALGVSVPPTVNTWLICADRAEHATVAEAAEIELDIAERDTQEIEVA